MKILKAHILLMLVIVLAAVSCSRKEARVIPASKMSKIYADMVIADQWIRSDGRTLHADTTLVYEPIFNKYGYTTEDYRKSVSHYLRKPGDFADIFEDARSILQKQIVEMVALEKVEALSDSIRIKREGIIANLTKAEIFDGLPLLDSVRVQIDSMDRYVLVHMSADTTTNENNEKICSEIPVPPRI